MKLLKNNKSIEPEFQLQKEMEAEMRASYSSMLLNMSKVLITEVKKELEDAGTIE